MSNTAASASPHVSVKTSATAASQLAGNAILASSSAGEISFVHTFPALDGLLPGVELGPIRYVLNGAGRLLKSIPVMFKDKKKGAFILVLSLFWLILLLLSALGINNSVVTGLSFLTFAQGGAVGGIPGLIGGIVGKGVFAYFITAMLLPLFSGGKPFSGLGRGLKTLFGSLAFKNSASLSALLLGAGLALIVYNAFTGNGSLQNSMAGIAALLLSLQALSNKAGFLRGFFMSFLKKTTGTQMPDTTRITKTMAGWAAGFAVGVVLSVTGISIISYLVGFVLVVISLILKLAAGSKKKAVTA